MTYVEVGWMCEGVTHSFCIAVKQLSEPKKHHWDGLMSSTSCSVVCVLWSVAYSLTCRNVPLLHTSTQRPGMSLHVISFTRSSPTLVLQVASAGWEGLGTRLSYTSSSCIHVIHSDQHHSCLEGQHTCTYSDQIRIQLLAVITNLDLLY